MLYWHPGLAENIMADSPIDFQNYTSPEDADPALLGGNWSHYSDAYRIWAEFCESLAGNLAREAEPQAGRHTSKPTIHPENAIVPAPDYLCVYADLLGFSREVQFPGPDSLPDFYGAALVGAVEWPAVKIFLLSDSFIAAAPAHAASDLIQMLDQVTNSWRASGMLPQIAIGYGTFAQRRPFREITPPNFIGVQIAGTSLVDAVNAHKKSPLGSRLLVSPSALAVIQQDPSVKSVVRDDQGSYEWFADRGPRRPVFDCVYYALCLRSHKRGSRIYQHYIWSMASRLQEIGEGHIRVVLHLVDAHCDEAKLKEIVQDVKTAFDAYQTLL